MTAPRPIATNLFSIAVPLEASLPTLVSRTSSICACHDELEMNTQLGMNTQPFGRGDGRGPAWPDPRLSLGGEGAGSGGAVRNCPSRGGSAAAKGEARANKFLEYSKA